MFSSICNEKMKTFEINARDKAVIRALQGDFPLCEEPYKILAEQAGMTEEEFINCVKNLSEEKKIRKMGAVLKHREAGFIANALCAWSVPNEKLDEVAQVILPYPIATIEILRRIGIIIYIR